MNKKNILLGFIVIAACFVFAGCGNKDGVGGFSGFHRDIFSFSFKQEPRFIIDNDSETDTKYGYINSSGAVVIQPKFDSANAFENGVAKVSVRKDGAYYTGLIDINGNYIIQPEYQYIGDFHENLAYVRTEGKEGYVNKKGEFVIWPKFDSAWNFHNGLAKIEEEGCIGYINKKGDYVVYPKYKNGTDFKNGFAIVEDNGGKYHLLTKSGEVKKSFPYEAIYLNYCGENNTDSLDLYIFKANKKCGVISSKGEVVIPAKYDDINLIGDGKYISYEQNDKYGIMNRKGTVIFSPQFNYTSFKDGYFICTKEGNHYIYNEKGTQTYKTENYLFSLSDGVIMYRDSNTGKYSYIDVTGKRVINAEFDDANDFHNGLAYAKRTEGDNNYTGFINKSGKFVWKRTKKVPRPAYYCPPSYSEYDYSYDSSLYD